jgi:L-lactate dehydrogenase
MTRQKAAAGEAFEHPWLLDGEGRPTRDPRVMEQAEPRGSLLLLGGLEYGHKGFGLALMVEALTQGLSGLGRKDTEKRWGGNVFLQVLDPDAFAGRGAFLEEMDHLTELCHANAPAARGRAGADAGRAGGAQHRDGPRAWGAPRRAYRAAARRIGRAVRPRHAGRPHQLGVRSRGVVVHL